MGVARLYLDRIALAVDEVTPGSFTARAEPMEAPRGTLHSNFRCESKFLLPGA
jgi:hypothetical protein